MDMNIILAAVAEYVKGRQETIARMERMEDAEAHEHDIDRAFEIARARVEIEYATECPIPWYDEQPPF